MRYTQQRSDAKIDFRGEAEEPGTSYQFLKQFWDQVPLTQILDEVQLRFRSFYRRANGWRGESTTSSLALTASLSARAAPARDFAPFSFAPTEVKTF